MAEHVGRRSIGWESVQVEMAALGEHPTRTLLDRAGFDGQSVMVGMHAMGFTPREAGNLAIGLIVGKTLAEEATGP